jgi:hypothetical protein
LNAEFQAATGTAGAAQQDELQTVTVRPRMSDISVSLIALAWAPYWLDDAGKRTAAWD